MLPAGMEIDRYGNPTGSYFAPTRTPIDARSLACDPVALHIPHYCYVVQQPLSFEACKIAAWFGQPGGGMQYFSNRNAAGLASAGRIRQVRCR
jgi:Tuberculosis necrotizing toxin